MKQFLISLRFSSGCKEDLGESAWERQSLSAAKEAEAIEVRSTCEECLFELCFLSRKFVEDVQLDCRSDQSDGKSQA